jgi:biotin-(acetyl-CoA carboxylase) ligase
VVTGIGLNVNQTRDQLALDAPTEPASLRTSTGTTYDRAVLVGSLLFRLERMYDVWRHGGLADLYSELGPRDFLRGRRITVGGEPGTALQILRDGRLEIETHSGEVRTIESGEVLYAR